MTFPTRLSIALAVCVAASTATAAQAAEWSCQISQPVTGGMLQLVLEGDGAEISTANGAVELYTASAPAPLGLRDGTYTWETPTGALATAGGVLSMQFEVRLPISENPTWGAAAGNIIPTRFYVALPPLADPTGNPIDLTSLAVISGNGVYETNNDWSIRGGDSGVLLTNAPEPLSLIYSRELLQLISPDPNEPISIFLTPAVPGGRDSIASFHTGGLVETPTRVSELLDLFVASGSTCEQP
jgi:hypothetical protein